MPIMNQNLHNLISEYRRHNFSEKIRNFRDFHKDSKRQILIMLFLGVVLTPISCFFGYILFFTESKQTLFSLFVTVATFGSTFSLYVSLYQNFSTKETLSTELKMITSQLIPFIMKDVNLINKIMGHSIFNMTFVDESLSNTDHYLVERVCSMVEQVHIIETNNLPDSIYSFVHLENFK